ncbi:MAG TPA: TetR/AcrR family transcriptional regulator [Gemmatimonadales bacterium]|jgi:AcrR family transcriptional regulator
MTTRRRTPKRRKYTLHRRAEQQSETRRRIVEAVYALHGEIGPARTTIKAIAERAGVERLTVYRHFSDEGEIFAACSAHFQTEIPPPDPAAWDGITDPAARLRAALLAFYDYYRRGEKLLANANRDSAALPALAALLAPFAQFVEAVREDLEAAWPAGGSNRARLAAAIGHALRFDTWRSLAYVEGLDDEAAVALMVDLARAAAEPDPVPVIQLRR